MAIFRRAIVVVAFVAMASCSKEPVDVRCTRTELGSMGAENQFQLRVADDEALVLDDAADRLDIGITIVPPASGPITLVQRAADGREIVRFVLNVPAINGISTRCTVGSTPLSSTCGASMSGAPASAHP
jgi:hypothetical protein